MKKDYIQIGKEEANKAGFEIEKLIYSANYYSGSKLRNTIYSGWYQDKRGVLKIYDDPRITDEPIAMSLFHNHNKSEIITAPQIYQYKIKSLNKGWFVMEELPDNGEFLKPAINKESRQKLLQIFLEYRTNFPHNPWRKLNHNEKLPANIFHQHRMARWFGLAAKKEVWRKEKFISDKYITKTYPKILKKIDKHFLRRSLFWCHGHFKPQELYTTNQEKIYLIDFAHTGMFPEGYELAFMIWAGFLMQDMTYNKPYMFWKNELNLWVKDLIKLAKVLQYKEPKNLIYASVLERLTGTILADISASDKELIEVKIKLKYLNNFTEELLRKL